MTSPKDNFLNAAHREGLADVDGLPDGKSGTRGWSTGKKHRDKGDPFSLGGRRRKAPITLASVKRLLDDGAA